MKKEMEVSPAYDIETEAMLLGCILHDNGVLPDIEAILNGGGFYNTAHQTIYGVMVDMHTEGRTFDLVLLRSELQERDLLEPIGGNEYLGSLFISVASSVNAVRYAEVVAKHARRRQLEMTLQAHLSRLADPTADVADVADEVSTDLELVRITCAGKSPLSFSSLDLQEEPAPVEWLLRPLFPVGCLCGIQGEPGSGKSYLMLDGCLRGALGQDWIEQVSDAFVTLFVDCERDRRLALERFRQLTTPDERVQLQNFHCWFPMFLGRVMRLFPLDESPNRRLLTDEVKRVGARLVVLDSLSRLWGKLDPNLEGAIMGAWLRELVDETGACVVVVHHVAKQQDKFRGRDPHVLDWRGSGALPACLDVQLAMTRRKEDYMLHLLRSVWAEGSRRWALSGRDPASGAFRPAFQDVSSGRGPDKRDSFTGFVVNLAADGQLHGMPTLKLCQMYEGQTGEKIGEGTARRALEGLKADEVIRKVPSGRGHVWSAGLEVAAKDAATQNEFWRETEA